MRIESIRYPALMRWTHWLSAVLVVVAYISSESAEELQSGGGQWHVLAGLLLMILFVPRLVGHLLRGHAVPGESTHPAERLASHAVHLALLLFVVVQPLLGIMALWGGGESIAIPMSGWTVAPLVTIDAQFAHSLEEAHEVIGQAFYFVIALHVGASLWHQFVRRDGVLRRML